MERPKFCVGELVGIESVLRPELNCKSTEVIEMEPFEGIATIRKIPYKGWTYFVSDNCYGWLEVALRKLPKDSRNSYDALMERLTIEDELEMA